MSNDRFQYECALSGIVVDGGTEFDDDGLGDLPVGWIEVRMTRRLPNPKHALIQQVKKALLHGMISQFPEDQREGQAAAIQIQLEANFFLLEQSTSPFIVDSESVYLAPPEASEAVLEAFNQARELMGMEPFVAPEEGEEEEGE